jgi:hypothetical protein
VRVIPVEAGVGETAPGSCNSRRPGSAVGSRAETPSYRCSSRRQCQCTVVAMSPSFRVCTVISTLLDLQGRTGHGAVVGEHPQLGAANVTLLDHQGEASGREMDAVRTLRQGLSRAVIPPGC